MRASRVFITTVFFVTFSFLRLSSSTLAGCLPDTGQTKCYDNHSEITCPSPGEDFYGQDAQHPCNPNSYTSLAGGIMVQDNVTGLVWENKTDDGSIHDKDNIYNWNHAQSVFIATLNNDNFGGYSDWRLPTINELSFIRNLGNFDPSINTDYFTNTVSSYYWSSTTCAGLPPRAWFVGFGYGDFFYGSKSSGVYVRAVRSGQCGSFGNFVDNGDGTVTDTDTGLMWQQATAPGAYNTWQEALDYCKSLSLADYTDWRLPSVNELLSIVDYSRYYPAINTDYFPNTESSFYWSSTTFPFDPNYAWYVYFDYGYLYNFDKSYFSYVRAVRSGQCGSFDTSTTTTVASTTTTSSGSTTTAPSSTTTTTCICPIVCVFDDNSEEAELLRYLRDNVLSRTPEGQEIIRLYYEWSSAVVKAMEEDEAFKAQVKEMIDEVLILVEGEIK